MTNRKRFKGDRDKRVSGQFVALPFDVIDCAAYRSTGYAAKALLIDLARQFRGNNNGSLVACAKYLRPLGWISNDTIFRAKAELLSAGLLVETRKGRFPSTPAWYALSWRSLDVSIGLDINPTQYRVGAYRSVTLVPGIGARPPSTAPPIGVMTSPSAPDFGVVTAAIHPVPAPKSGEYLEKPSTQVSCQA